MVFGKFGARDGSIAFYRELQGSPEFVSPRRWSECTTEGFAALFLAGGLAPGMKQYLSSEVVQRITIAAICHGVLVAARSKAADGHSVLHCVRTTCLPKHMEPSAYLATFWRRGRYYRTHPAYVEDEVCGSIFLDLTHPSNFH